MKIRLVFAALVAGSFAASASAQQLKPGLWEITNKIQDGGSMDKAAPDVQQQIANMPPEQRKAIEAMMAKQGMKMGASGPGSMSVKACMTKDMIERNEIPAAQGDCKTTKQQRNGNTVNMAFACTNPPSSGEGQFSVQSPEAYTMKMEVRSTGGKQQRTTRLDGTGKWLGADCGSIKPVQAPAKK